MTERLFGSRALEKSKYSASQATDGTAEYWATSLERMSAAEQWESFAKSARRIQMYHGALKQQCLIERAQCRRFRPVSNHIGLCIRAFVRLESHCYRERISWIEAKTSIIRDAARCILIESALFASPNCVSPNTYKIGIKVYKINGAFYIKIIRRILSVFL